jgi:Acetyltransferases, including N-acetylases of ribosomal proteins
METARLIIRRFTIADKKDVYDYAKHPEVGPNAGWKPHTSVEHSEMIIRNIFLLQTHGFAIVDKATHKVIGSINLHKRPFLRNYELGYSLSYDYWGQGLMSEAAAALLAYGFDQLGARRIFAKTDTNNARSKRVLLKQGMTHYKFKPQDLRRYDGTIIDMDYFELTKEQWRTHAKT